MIALEYCGHDLSPGVPKYSIWGSIVRMDTSYVLHRICVRACSIGIEVAF
jgi:hypothetical protein